MHDNEQEGITRRGLLAAGIASTVGAHGPSVRGQGGARRKIKLGVVGCGGRGAWIARLFHEDGGYAIHAVADYFPQVAEACGRQFGIDRCFSGLSGYRRVIESGVEAISLETPPFFFPEHAAAAVDAGLHVYMAKPVAVGVPGCRAIEAAAKKAGEKGRCFLVDYQMPTEPHNQEVVRQVREGAIGKPVLLCSHYLAGPFSDPPLGRTIEDRLRNLVWVNDVAIGGGYHVNACIHALDAALWLAQGVPVAASGVSAAGRKDPHGDSHDVFALAFEFENGLVLQHRGKHLGDGYSGDGFCGCAVHGQDGHAQITYNGRAQLVSGRTAFREEVANLYEAGARRNIALFHRQVMEGDHTNPTVRRAVDSCLATILGREAGRRKARITMAQLLRENRRVEADLRGLRT